MCHILAADTSQNYVAIIIIKANNASFVHRAIRNLIGFPRDRILHLREMSSRMRRHLTNKVAKNFREIAGYIEKNNFLTYEKTRHKHVQ